MHNHYHRHHHLIFNVAWHSISIYMLIRVMSKKRVVASLAVLSPFFCALTSLQTKIFKIQYISIFSCCFCQEECSTKYSSLYIYFFDHSKYVFFGSKNIFLNFEDVLNRPLEVYLARHIYFNDCSYENIGDKYYFVLSNIAE